MKRTKAVAIDPIKFNNDLLKQDTDSHTKDRVYNWIVDKYTSRGKKFVFWDRFVWKGSVYMLPEFFGYIIFFAVFYYLGGLVLRNYGWERMVAFYMLLIIWRLNSGLALLNKVNKKLGGPI